MELEQPEEEVISKSQKGIYKETNLEDLLIRATNKSWNRCIRFCIRSMSFAEA